MADDMIEIVVVGAHLSGMPLNGDLVALGGVLRRKAQTTADYRFYALAGGPPKRPGLLRVEDGAGGAIETEVWALPAAGFGRFVASIPAPSASAPSASRTAPTPRASSWSRRG